MKKLDRAQIIALMLVVALIINAALHYIHPAYRYYHDKFAALEGQLIKRIVDYERNIATNVVPAFLAVSSNNLEIIKVQFANALNTVNTNLVNNHRVNNVNDDSRKIQNVNGHYFRCGDLRGVCIDDIPYFLGDAYHGADIISIDKSSVTTTDGIYFFVRGKKNLNADITNKEG